MFHIRHNTGVRIGKRVCCFLEAHAVFLFVDGGFSLIPLEVYVPIARFHMQIIHT